MTRASRFLLAWLAAVGLEWVLVLFTFKARLASTGMDAARAYSLALIWESVHLFLIVLAVPALFLAAAWRCLWRRPLLERRAVTIAPGWLVVPTVWYFTLLAESAFSRTIVPVDGRPVLAALRLLSAITALAVITTTVLWAVRRHARPS